MKTAKEMFEELGYERRFYGEDIISYENKKDWRIDKNIDFYLEDKIIECFQISVAGRLELSMTPQELQAINKQVEELGWLDEKTQI